MMGRCEPLSTLLFIYKVADLLRRPGEAVCAPECRDTMSYRDFTSSSPCPSAYLRDASCCPLRLSPLSYSSVDMRRYEKALETMGSSGSHLQGHSFLLIGVLFDYLGHRPSAFVNEIVAETV